MPRRERALRLTGAAAFAGAALAAAIAACSALVDTSGLAAGDTDAGGDGPAASEASTTGEGGPADEAGNGGTSDAAGGGDAGYDPSAPFCDKHPGHAFCADFDQSDDVTIGWTVYQEHNASVAGYTARASDRSAPNAFGSTVQVPATDGYSFARLTWDMASFRKVTVEADVLPCVPPFSGSDGTMELLKVSFDTPTNTGDGVIISVGTNGPRFSVETHPDGGHVTDVVPAPPFPADRWLHFTMHVTLSDTAGHADYSVDGDPSLGVTLGEPTFTSNATNVNVQIGAFQYLATTSCTVLYDNVTIDVFP